MKKKIVAGVLCLSLALQPMAVCMAGELDDMPSVVQETKGFAAENESMEEGSAEADQKKNAAEEEVTEETENPEKEAPDEEKKESTDPENRPDGMVEIPESSKTDTTDTDRAPETENLPVKGQSDETKASEEVSTQDAENPEEITSLSAEKTYRLNAGITAVLADGTMTISGTGAIQDYTEYSSTPWYTDRTEIKKLVIGEGITGIGKYNFVNLWNMAEVSLPKSLLTIGEAAFDGDMSLQEVQIPDNVTKIEKGAFADCIRLSSVHLGKKVQKIGAYAFQETKVSGIDIPASVTSLDALAFFGDTSLTDIRIDAASTSYKAVENVVYTADRKKLILYPLGKKSVSYTIPRGTEMILTSAFQNNTWLQQVEIPDTVTVISDWAFANTALKSIVIPDTVTNIGYGICDGCAELKTAVIGDKVSVLPYLTFSGCQKLTEVRLGKGLAEIGMRAFYTCSSLTSVQLSNGVKKIGTYAFYQCTSLKSLVLPKTVNCVEKDAFYGCTGLHVTYPDDLAEMEDGSYRYSKSLYYSGTYHYTDAYEVLKLVNKERASVGLPALIMDKDLLENAMQRAAEITLDFSHTRPSGMSCFSINTQKMSAENIAVGSSTAADVVKLWMNSSGHRANILMESFQSIGIGCFEQGGTRFWVQVFGIPKADVGTKPSDRAVTTTIKIDPAAYQNYIKLVWEDEETVNLSAGKTKRLQVRIYNPGWTYAYSKPDARSFTWSSSNPKVASVDGKGNVRGVSAGTAKITVSGAGLNGSYNVTVRKTAGNSGSSSGSSKPGSVTAEKAAFDLTNFTLKVKKSWTLHVRNLSAGEKVVSWKSSNTKVATVKNGKVTAKKKTGKVTITATLSSGKSIKTTVKVQKGDVKTTNLTLTSPKTVNLKVKKTAQITTVRKPVTVTQSIKYSSSNKKVAAVSSKGKITAKKAGKATITVKSGSKKVNVTVKVTK